MSGDDVPAQAPRVRVGTGGEGVMTYRARGLRFGMGVIGVWGQASATSTVLATPDQPAWQDGLVVAVTAIFFLVVVAYRVGWACIEAHPWGVVVRNPFRRYELPWSQVAGFTAGNVGVLPKVAVLTRDGRTVPVAGLPVAGGQPGGSVGAALAALKDRLQQADTVMDQHANSASDPVAEPALRGARLIGGLLLLLAMAAVVQAAGGLTLRLDRPAIWASAATVAYATLVWLVSRPLFRAGADGVSVELTMAGVVVAGGGVAGLLSNRSAPLIVGVAIAAAWILILNKRSRQSRSPYA